MEMLNRAFEDAAAYKQFEEQLLAPRQKHGSKGPGTEVLLGNRAERRKQAQENARFQKRMAKA